MGVDLNYIGIEMGVTNPDDRTTSYVTFIGELLSVKVDGPNYIF